MSPRKKSIVDLCALDDLAVCWLKTLGLFASMRLELVK